MTDALTLKQALWAASHDWYNGRREDGAGGYIVTVRDVYWLDDHNTATRFLDFTNIHQLRHWAGYWRSLTGYGRADRHVELAAVIAAARAVQS